MPSGRNLAEEALTKAQHGEPLNTNDRWAIHRRLMHFRNAVEYQLTDILPVDQKSVYTRAISSR